MRTSTGLGGTGARNADLGAHRRADIYSDEQLWRRRYDNLLADRDVWRNFAALARFAVLVPRGEVASAYATREEKPPPVVVVPLQRVAPDGVPAKPRIHHPRKGQR